MDKPIPHLARRAQFGATMTPIALSRWQGSKRWQVATHSHTIAMPNRGRLFDTFAGSCVVSLWALAQGKRVVIGDTNARCIGCLRNLQSRCDAVVGMLEAEVNAHRDAADQRADFYLRREQMNGMAPDSLEAGALFLFMLRAGFNGLYRENQDGVCNTTYGDPKPSKDLVRADELRTIAALLQRADIRHGDFETTCADMRRCDTGYFDAPYVGTYTGYSKGGFSPADRRRLGVFLRDLDRRGIRWTATDSADHGALIDHGLWHVEYVDVRRSGSCKAEGRGNAREIIVTNWLPRKEAS